MLRFIKLAAIVLIATVAPTSSAQAECPQGQTLKYECYSWQNDCAEAWIKTCWCCVAAT